MIWYLLIAIIKFFLTLLLILLVIYDLIIEIRKLTCHLSMTVHFVIIILLPGYLIKELVLQKVSIIIFEICI